MPKIHSGLSNSEVRKLLNRYGENRIEKTHKFSWIGLLLDQFKSPLIYILLIAGLISMFFSHSTDAVIVLAAVVVNVALGYYQEYKAERSLEALERVVRVSVDVLRNGKRVKIEMTKIVPGDVIFLKSGDKVPADGIVVKSESMSINEAVLTGESVPVEKRKIEGKFEIENFENIGESSKAYMGTTVLTGIGSMIVVNTGGKTKVGMIASRLAGTIRERTILQKRLASFARVLTYIVVLVAGLIFVIGFMRGEVIADLILVSVAVAVSAIPEGLIVALTAILAVGMQRILKRRGLVRKLLAAEALGSVTVVCSDKTGTLTKGEMSVSFVEGDEEELASGAILSNDMADPLEIAMSEWGTKIFSRKKIKAELKKWKRGRSLPFSSQLKYAVVEGKNAKKSKLVLRGAPEIVMGLTTLKSVEKKKLQKKFDELSNQGYRLVGMAKRNVVAKDDIKDQTEEGGFIWLGLIIFDDPVREDVEKDIKKLSEAGIDFKVITGDFAGTAGYVMKQLNIDTKKRVVVGEEFEKMGTREKVKTVRNNVLFARFSPETKLEVVKILQGHREVVAMMGDGVNDAPALKKADVGIVVSTASEVSKETADMVLLDDDFSTVVEAVEEGRGIYANIRKVVLYLLSDSFSEIILVIGSIFLGIPLPLTAAQILWINLANDSFPALALTLEPLENGLMKKGPRRTDEPLFDSEMKSLITIISGFTGIYVLASFWFMLRIGYGVDYARTIAFLFLGLDSLMYVFVARSLTKPIWKINLFSNIWLIIGVLIGLVMQISVLYVPYLQRVFKTHSPTLLEWGIVIVGVVFLLVTIEGVKYLYNRDEGR